MRFKALGIEQHNIGTKARLQLLRFGEYGRAGGCLEIEITAFVQTDFRLVAVEGEMLADIAQKIDAVERDVNIHRRGELLPDGGRR